MEDGLVPVNQDEVTALLSTSAGEYPITVPLRQDRLGALCVDSTQVDAAAALAKLANLRGQSASHVRVGGPIVHTGARHVGGGNPDDRLAAYEKCEECGGAEFMCANSPGHDDDESADGYNFPNYGARLDHQRIQELLMRSGLVNEYGAAQLAAWLDMQAYVLREPNEEN